MKTNGKATNCEFAEEIVSYLYDELAVSERSKFETHLAGCSICTDEFAGLSNARFSVFEWQREEFAPLATPRFEIPHKASSVKAIEPANEGWLAGLRATLFGWPGLAGAAAVLITVGAAFFAINYRGHTTTADVRPIVAETPIANLPAPQKTEEKTVASNIPAPTAIETNSDVKREARPVRAANVERKPRQMRNLTAETVPPAAVREIKPTQKAPVLSALEEEDDGSLRLSDLFEEGGV